MSAPGPDDPWMARSAAARAALAQWRLEHPQATLAEIEHAVDAHLSAARAALIGTLATDATDDRRVCADCGQPLVRVGTRSRRVRTAQDGAVTFTEPAWRCPACGAGLFPPD